MDKDKKNPDTLGRCQDLNISCKARTRHKDSQYLTDEQVVKMVNYSILIFHQIAK